MDVLLVRIPSRMFCISHPVTTAGKSGVGSLLIPLGSRGNAWSQHIKQPVHIHVRMLTCLCPYIHTHMHMYTHSHTGTHAHTYTPAYIHTYTLIHVHMYIHSLEPILDTSSCRAVWPHSHRVLLPLPPEC